MADPVGGSTPAEIKTCSRGCTPAEPDNCMASAIVACPLGYWTGEINDVNPICGCHVRSRCGTCSGCTSCDACYCGKDY